MLALQNLLLCSSFLTLAHAASCPDHLSDIATALSRLPEVQSFCSSRFPLSTTTITKATPTVSTTSTTTITVTPWTTTATIVGPSSTKTKSETSTSVITEVHTTTYTTTNIGTITKTQQVYKTDTAYLTVAYTKYITGTFGGNVGRDLSATFSTSTSLASAVASPLGSSHLTTALAKNSSPSTTTLAKPPFLNNLPGSANVLLSNLCTCIQNPVVITASPTPVTVTSAETATFSITATITSIITPTVTVTNVLNVTSITNSTTSTIIKEYATSFTTLTSIITTSTTSTISQVVATATVLCNEAGWVTQQSQQLLGLWGVVVPEGGDAFTPASCKSRCVDAWNSQVQAFALSSDGRGSDCACFNQNLGSSLRRQSDAIWFLYDLGCVA